MSADWYVVSGSGGSAEAPKSGPFVRTILIKDTTIGPEIVDEVTAFSAIPGQVSKIRRIVGVLKIDILQDLTIDLTVRYPANSTPPKLIGSFTIPMHQNGPSQIPLVWTTADFEWDTLPDLGMFTVDIVGGTTDPGFVTRDKNGVAAYTIEWEGRGTGTPTAPGIAFQGGYDSGSTYVTDDMVYVDGKSYVSLQDANTGHDPVTESDWWGVVAAGTAGTVAVGTVTTGAAGSSATVTNVGTDSAAILDFEIPRGDTGATGATGATGPAGPTVYPGAGVPQSTGSAWGSSLTLDTDGALAADADTRLATQKAVKTYVDARAPESVQLEGSLVGTRKILNFIAGENITIAIDDDSGGGRVNITINATGGGFGSGGGSVATWGMSSGVVW